MPAAGWDKVRRSCSMLRMRDGGARRKDRCGVHAVADGVGYGMLRACLVGTLLACAVWTGTLLVACGSESSAGASGFSSSGSSGGSSGGPPPDSGTGFDAPEDSVATDGPPQDASVTTGALFVHASPDLPDLRFCWYVSTDADAGPAFSATDVPFPSAAPAPFSNYPAVAVGSAATLPDASTMLGGELTIVGLEANVLAQVNGPGSTPRSCADLLETSGGNQFPLAATHPFPAVPAGTILSGQTNLVAVAGCLPGIIDPKASASRCGAGWTTALGNLHVDVLPFQGVTATATGQIPVQAAQLSGAFAAQLGDGGAAVVSFGAQGATSPVATLSNEGNVAPSSATAVDAGTTPSNYGSLGFGVDLAGSDGGPAHLWMSLEQSLRLVAPMEDPSKYYTQTTTYVVAVVGDPSAPHATPDAAYDGTGLHLLVLPLP